MGRDAEVGLQQPRAALLVRHPVVVEHHARALEAQGARERRPPRRPPRARRAPAAPGASRPGTRARRRPAVATPHGSRSARRASPRSRRPTAARARPPARARRASPETKTRAAARRAPRRARPRAGRARRGSSASRPASTPSHRSRWRSLAHSVKSAAARCAAAARPTIRFSRAPRRRGLRARGLDRLDHGRVVEVDHEPGRLLPDPPQQARREELGDDHVVLPHGADQRVVVGQPGLQQPQPGVLLRQRAPPGRGERDRGVRGERAGELVGADRRPGHAGADRFCRDDEDARRRQVEQYGRLERRPTGRARHGCDRARAAARGVGVRQPAGRRAGRARPLRAGARRGQPRARRRDLPAHARAAEGVRRAARRAGAARRRPRHRPVGGEADAHVRRPRGAERVRVRLQRPEADRVGCVRRDAHRRSLGAAADLHRHLSALGLRPARPCDAGGGSTQRRAARRAPRQRADLLRAAGRGGHAHRRRARAGDRDDADGRLLRRGPERLRAGDRRQPLLHRGRPAPAAARRGNRRLGRARGGRGGAGAVALARAGAAARARRDAALDRRPPPADARPRHGRRARDRRPDRRVRPLGVVGHREVAARRRGRAVVRGRAEADVPRPRRRRPPRGRQLRGARHDAADLALPRVGRGGDRAPAPRRRLRHLAPARRPRALRRRRGRDHHRGLRLPAPHRLRRAGPPRAARARAPAALRRRDPPRPPARVAACRGRCAVGGRPGRRVDHQRAPRARSAPTARTGSSATRSGRRPSAGACGRCSPPPGSCSGSRAT